MPVIVYTGDGKGKTSAGLGAVLRALGARKTAVLTFFFKGWLQSSEKRVLRRLEKDMQGRKLLDIEYVRVCGWVRSGSADAKTRRVFASALRGLLKKIERKPFLILADEIITAYKFKLITSEEIKNLIATAKRNEVALILTGRGWPSTMNKYADIITDMKKVKHWYDEGHNAVKGIDW